MKRHKPCYEGSCDHPEILGRKEKEGYVSFSGGNCPLEWHSLEIGEVIPYGWKEMKSLFAFLIFPLLSIFFSLSQYKINDES